MRNLRIFFLILITPVLFFSCTSPNQEAVDLIVYNATVYTVDEATPQAEAFAVKAGRFVAVGTTSAIREQYTATEELDAQGAPVYPGLIDAHAHLMGLGMNQLRVDLMGTESVEDIVARLQDFAQTLPEDAWLLGRGWDQNDWPVKEFPTKADLDTAFPDRPVWLTRVDGHAAWGNSAALGFVGEQLRHLPDPNGGKIIRDPLGEATGVFIDQAMGLVGRYVPPTSEEDRNRALQLAIAACLEHGLTGVHDAGVGLGTIEQYKAAIDADEFNVRLYGMIGGAGQTLDHFVENGSLLDYGDKLTVRSVKLYMDGALGSRGAALLADYSDEPGNQGLLMAQEDAFNAIVNKAMRAGLQVNTHAIGDRGNRVVLDAYERHINLLEETEGRHRVEHAQVVALEDIPRFKTLGLIASMQPTHATSDMYWAEDRVGPERVKGAYAWRKFLDQGTVIASGSDFPVERVDPMLGFYAAVTRQDAQAWPEGGWYPEENMTRAEALQSFTLDAAYAAFQEDQLGSITAGKWADFIILSQDIMTIAPLEILNTDVRATYLGGVRVFGAQD